MLLITHIKLLQKIQMLTDAPEEKNRGGGGGGGTSGKQVSSVPSEGLY